MISLFLDTSNFRLIVGIINESNNNTTFTNLEVIYKKELKLYEKINCYYSFENNHV